MTFGTLALDAESLFAVMAGSTGLTLLHLFHGHLFMPFGVEIELAMTILAVETDLTYVGVMAEDDIPGLASLDRQVSSSDNGKG